jgi:alpha-1,3/alpha-1,6-mannosyltransferase
VPNTLKDALLKSARLLVYTPSNEHFGIVPLEAMLAGTPVMAANTGGPLETVVDGVTGWLCPPDDVEAWTVVMDKVLHRMSDAQLQKMAEAGRQRVVSEFSDVKMAERLEGIIDRMAGVPRQSSTVLTLALTVLSTVPLVGMLAVITLWKLYSS